jgi:hypothetical protein
VLAPDAKRSAQAIVRVGRRHPNVHDGDVGTVGADLAHEVVGVCGLADDVEPALSEQADDPLAQQH